jgi:hypothetical protein
MTQQNKPLPIGLFALSILAKLHTDRALEDQLRKRDEDEKDNRDRNDKGDKEAANHAIT